MAEVAAYIAAGAAVLLVAAIIFRAWLLRRPTAEELERRRRLAINLDSALTAVMRAAYAAQRAEIGALGYDDRIFRRKAMARPEVHALTAEAERLLTLRESHRLNGIPPAPLEPAV